MTYLATLILLFAPPAEFTGKVVSVSDGDTITVLVDKTQVKVRLNGIDAPESKQAFGNRAKQALGDAVHGKDVRVVKTGEDRYGRTLGTVYVDGKDINAKMVEDGFAWHYRAYSKDKTLAELEVKAREAKRGLWADKEPVPPWDWRKARKRDAAGKRAA